MFWPFRTKEPSRLSEIVEGALGALLRETNHRFIHVYWPMLGDDLGELFSRNYKSFVLTLARHALMDQVNTSRFSGVRLLPDQVEQGWRQGMEETLQRRSKTHEAYQRTLEDYELALSEYDQAIADAASKGFPASDYFLITARFADRVVDLGAPERRTVMEIAVSITDLVVGVWKRAPKQYHLTGP
ncbi:MAG: hypothetical protein Q7T82_18040 [Armatimonadota bacterium]|nr:hypothetical protein [Armatimonadota bacterium]